MTRDRLFSALPSAFGRAAVYLFVAAQLMLAFAPLVEWQSSDARPHVEAAGSSAHHAHNPADCAACAGRAMLAIASASAEPAIGSIHSAPPGLGERDEHLALLRESESRPRAPPIRPA